MFRTPLRVHNIRCLSTPVNSRNLVSSVLLTRTWENDSLTDLKQEAKKRGLPQKGKKAVLIARIQEYDQRAAHSFASHDPPALARSASTAATPSTTPSATPPADPSAVANALLSLQIKLPDLSVPPPEQEVHIPFAPDFWESSRVKKESEPPVSEEPAAPKIVVIGGESTYPAGGPTHNLLPTDGVLQFQEVAEATTDSDTSSATGLRALWADIAADAGLPTTLKLGSAKSQKELVDGLFEATTTSTSTGPVHSRTLDKDEVRGVWVLLGALGGSWLLAGLFQAESAFVEHPDETKEA